MTERTREKLLDLITKLLIGLAVVYLCTAYSLIGVVIWIVIRELPAALFWPILTVVISTVLFAAITASRLAKEPPEDSARQARGPEDQGF